VNGGGDGAVVAAAAERVVGGADDDGDNSSSKVSERQEEERENELCNNPTKATHRCCLSDVLFAFLNDICILAIFFRRKSLLK
jgi:hypothetical protein